MKLTFALWILLVSVAAAQQPRMSDVTCALLDSEGCWWYGTKGSGICRDDGHGMEVFRSDRDHPDLLGSNDVTCLAESRVQGEIWFGTKKGAYVLKKQDRTLRPLLPQELADMRLNCLLEDHEGRMWVAYRHTLLVFDALTDSVVRRFDLTWRGKNRSIVALAEDRSGTLWLSLWNGGLCRLLRGADTFEPCPWERNDYCTELRYDTLRHCILATTSTDARLMVRRGQNIAEPDVDMSAALRDALLRHAARRDSLLIAYAELPDSTFYLGTFHSLYCYRLPLDSLRRLPLETGRVRDLAAAADGTLYFISRQMGLCRLRGDSAEVLTAGSNLRSLELRGDSLLWLTDGLGNASVLDLRTGQITLIDASAPDSASDSTSYWWLWLLLLIPAVAIPFYVVRRRLQQTSDTEADTAPEAQPDLSAADRELLTRAEAAVAEHISDPDYGVDALAADLCMSRTALYRRLRQAGDVSPTDFIRNLRLDRAAELLRTTSSSVNEVADLVGFSYASYFTRCFKERFGVAPKDFR